MEKQVYETFLMKHPDWYEKDGELSAAYKLDSYAAVKDVIRQIMKVADDQNHHPTVTFGYNVVEVRTATHDAGNTITEKDIALAQKISNIIAIHLN